MPRIRSVHPGLFTDEAFVELSEAAQIFYVGVLTQCDDFGVFEWKPLQLRMRLRPTKDGAVDVLLEELAMVNMVCRYEIDGRQYGAVRNFCRYQRPKKPKSSAPLPDEYRTYVALTDTSTEPEDNDELPLSQKAEIAPQREEIRGRRCEGGESKADAFGARAPPKARKSGQKTALPADFAVDAAGAQYATERGFGPAEVARMSERFRNHHTAKGSTFADWRAAWRTWVTNQVEFNRERKPDPAAAAGKAGGHWDRGL